ncbi:MAG: hypothetical protein WC401_10050, partial [Bacteroidales bacterium]
CVNLFKWAITNRCGKSAAVIEAVSCPPNRPLNKRTALSQNPAPPTCPAHEVSGCLPVWSGGLADTKFSAVVSLFYYFFNPIFITARNV